MQSLTVKSSGVRWRVLALAAAVAMLLAPAIAMQFTSEVNWGPGDFGLFASLLAAVGCAFEALVRMTPRRAFRIAGAVVIVAAFLLLWGELAVGLW